VSNEYKKNNFDKNFQEKLAMIILDDRAFCDQILEVLDVRFFDLSYLQNFVSLIKDYKLEYSAHPSRDLLPSVIKSKKDKIDPVNYSQMIDFYKRLYKDEISTEGKDFIQTSALDFCKKQTLRNAMIKSVDKLDACSFEEVSDIINGALKLGLDRDYGYDYLKDFETRFVRKARDPVTTGWNELDAITRGGMGKGELGVCIAATGAGKSMALVHLGANALKQGKTVVHYSLELQDTVVATRYDSCLTGIGLDEIYNKKDQVFEKVKSLSGRLIVKEYPTKTASTQTIKAHLDKLVQLGEDIGMIIIDYGDLLRPVRDRKEKRTELESIYEEMRALGQIFECPVWTASQTNRSGLNERLVTMESISEAFNKCFVADFIFTLSRTIEDRNNNEGRFYIAKNRNGPDGIEFPIFMETRNVKIKVLVTGGTKPPSIIIPKKNTQPLTPPATASKSKVSGTP